MPIYEYECRKCGHRFERIQKVSDRRVRTCPECKGRVERLLSAPAIQFKGTGWYVTDYANKGRKGNGEGSKSEGGSPKGDGSSKGGDSSKGGGSSSE